MRRLTRSTQQGDTIIEVMFAVAVFAMVAVGSLSIMNQGIASAQRSLEITLVRQQMQAQAEALRYVHAAYVASYQPGGAPTTGTAGEWQTIKDNYAVGKASEFGRIDGALCSALDPSTTKPFVMNARTARVVSGIVEMQPPADESLPPFAQVVYESPTSSVIDKSYGMWVEAVHVVPTDGKTPYVDFHIRACWNSPGINRPLTLGTIVRLYDPAV